VGPMDARFPTKTEHGLTHHISRVSVFLFSWETNYKATTTQKTKGRNEDLAWREGLEAEVGASGRLNTEAVKGPALPLQGVDDVERGDGLPLSVLGVGDGVSDDILKEDLQDTSSLLVDETRDTLDTATTSETADGGLGDALDVVTQDLAMPLGASFA